MNQVVNWTASADSAEASAEETSIGLREALAILTAIDLGELLAELPASPAGRERHQTGVSLLGVLQRELQRLLSRI